MTPKFGVTLSFCLCIAWHTSVAQDSLGDGRLFYSASERAMLERSMTPASLLGSATEPEQPVKTIVSPPAPTVSKAVSFDGVVVRHGQAGSASAVLWIDRKKSLPADWNNDSLSEYRHSVTKYDQRFLLRPGQTGEVLIVNDIGQVSDE